MRLIIAVVLVCLGSCANAASNDRIWDDICWKESRYSPNPKPTKQSIAENAIGIAQIRPCVIEDCNNWGGHWDLIDRYDPIKSREIFDMYVNHWIKRYKDYPMEHDELVVRLWNGGPNGPHKSATNRYWEDILKHRKERSK